MRQEDNTTQRIRPIHLCLVWALLLLPLCASGHRRVMEQYTRDAERLQRKADAVAQTFRSDVSRLFGVRNWKEKALRYGDAAWCSLQSQNILDPSWVGQRRHQIDSALRDTSSAGDPNPANEDALALPHDRPVELKSQQVMMEWLLKEERRKQLAKDLLTPSWRARQADFARDRVNEIASLNDMAAGRIERGRIFAKAGVALMFVTLFSLPFLVRVLLSILLTLNRMLARKLRHSRRALYRRRHRVRLS